MEQSEESLMLAYAAGDAQAFVELYGRTCGKVYAFIKFRLTSCEAADEAFQAVYFKLHRKRRQFDPRFKFRQWIFVICRSCQVPTADDLAFATVLSETQAGSRTEGAAGYPEVWEDLPADQRRAIEMQVVEEQSFEQIVRALDRPEASARYVMTSSREDFARFEAIDPEAPPLAVSRRILDRVRLELGPPPWLVFAKIAFIHLATAALTLSVCPQFGFRVAGQGMGLMAQFMELGEVGSGAASGFFFLGSSVLVAALVLRVEEVAAFRRHRWAGLLALTVVSLGFFLLRAATAGVAGFAAAWVLGSMAGGWLTLELAFWARDRRAFRAA
jgi:RNA polymerase sigma-70 factor (ECF subfamily)